jgi:hypothetical protein
MPTIGQKTTKIKKSICGDFVTEDGGFVGILVKVAKGQYVICGVDNMLKIVWTSALFTAKEFKKHSICPITRQSNGQQHEPRRQT